MNAVQIILLIFLFYMILMYVSRNNNYNIVENWEIYNSFPYGESRTGTSPLSFYEYPRYRKPYMWPSKHYVEYPKPHCQNLDIQMY